MRATRIARSLAAHEHRTAAALFGLLVLVHLWPALVGHHVLAPTANMFLLPMWEAAAPGDLLDYVNRALEDVPVTYYPWDVIARQMIHAGTFPAWNPYALGGTPFFANAEVAWLSPFSLPLWILPLNYGLGVAAALKLWMAGFGAYLLARELRLGFWAGIVAGVSFALCAFDVAWLSHGVQVSVGALLPWTILLVERIVRDGKPVDGLALAGIVAFVLTGGHPGTQLHVLSAAVLYGGMRLGLSAGVARNERLRRAGWIGAGLLVGTLVAAVVLLPAQQAAIDSAGAFARRHGSTEFLGSRLSIGALRAALFPEWWGRPSELVLAGPAYFNERAFFAGGAAIVLALAAVLGRDGWRAKGPFVLLAALGVLVPLRAPGVHELVSHLPLFNAVQNQRMVLWFALAVAVMAGFGLHELLERPRSWQVWAALASAVAAALVAVGSIDLGGGVVGDALAQVVHRADGLREADDPLSDLALASVLWFLIPAAGLACVALAARRRPHATRWVGGLAALLVALEMLHFAHAYQPMAPADRAVPPVTQAIGFLQRHAGDRHRIVGVANALPADFSAIYGLRAASGDDPPQPSMRFYRLWHSAERAQTPGGIFTIENLERPVVKLMGLLGARYIVAPPGTPRRIGRLRSVYEGSDATIYLNDAAMPRAIVASRVRVVGDDDAEQGAVVEEGFDPRRDAVVRRDELGSLAVPATGGGGSVRVVREENARVTLRAELSQAGVVVLGDAWAPGWSVRVDGRPARALQADVVLRGVVVPAGDHEIVWSYRVPGLRMGLLLTLVGLLAAGAWGVWVVLRGRGWRRSG